MTLHVVIGVAQVAIASVITVLFLHWHFACLTSPFIFLSKVFMNSAFWLIPCTALCVASLGFLAFPGPPSRSQGAKLLAWQISLLVMASVYIVHGYEYNKDMSILSLTDVFMKIGQSKPNSAKRQILAAGLEIVKNVALNVAYQHLPYPESAFVWLLSNIYFGTFMFAVLPLVFTLVCFIMVNATRLDNIAYVRREELVLDRHTHERQNLI